MLRVKEGSIEGEEALRGFEGQEGVNHSERDAGLQGKSGQDMPKQGRSTQIKSSQGVRGT